MKLLSDERSKVLAEQHGWSLEHARGFVDGEACRRLGHTPSLSAVVGIDNYSLGFRAGYFERKNQERRHAAQHEDLAPVDGATLRICKA